MQGRDDRGAAFGCCLVALAPGGQVLIANGEYDKILAKWGLTDGAVKDPVINGALS